MNIDPTKQPIIYRANDVPNPSLPEHEGIWLIKRPIDSKFRIYVINESGNIAEINAITEQQLNSTDISDLTDTTNLLFSKNYNDLFNKPSIPESTSGLLNDSGFITINDIPSVGDIEAINVSYDNADSGLAAVNVQEAINETNERINNLDDIHNNLTGLQGGTVTQRYHLDQPEHEFVQSISPFRNPPTKGSIVFDPVLPPAIVGIGTGHGQLVQRDPNGNIKIGGKPFDDEDLADFGTVKEMTRHNIRVVDANNEIIETTTPHTLVLVSNPISTTIRMEPATAANLGYSVKFKVSGISSVLTPQGGSKIVDMDNVPQDDITLSGTSAEFISDGSNWQLVTELR